MGNHGRFDIKGLSSLLKDETKVKEIGSEIVKLAIKNVAEEKMELKPDEAMIERSISVGERVPADLIGTVQLDTSGNAAASWCQSWTDLWIWHRSWSESTSAGRGLRVGRYLPERLGAIVADIRLDPEEAKILSELGIRPGTRG